MAVQLYKLQQLHLPKTRYPHPMAAARLFGPGSRVGPARPRVRGIGASRAPPWPLHTPSGLRRHAEADPRWTGVRTDADRGHSPHVWHLCWL